MTRPEVRTFNVVAAPSRSRPQMSLANVRADLLAAKRLMGTSGIAGFTEISHGAIKAEFASIFGHRVGLRTSDCPIVWTPNFTKRDGGTDHGARAIPFIAPARKTAWAILEDGPLIVGVISTHMHPGGFAAKPSRAQRLRAPLIRLLWNRHSARIQQRVGKLSARCDVVVMVGDINRPGLTTWRGLSRCTARGLLYVGTNGEHGRAEYHHQHADHSAAVVTITAKEKP